MTLAYVTTYSGAARFGGIQNNVERRRPSFRRARRRTRPSSSGRSPSPARSTSRTPGRGTSSGRFRPRRSHATSTASRSGRSWTRSGRASGLHAAGGPRHGRRVRGRLLRRRLHDQPAARGRHRRERLDRPHLRGRAARARARRAGAAARPAPLLLEERQVAARAAPSGRGRARASGEATATTTTATRGKNSATGATDLAPGRGRRGRAESARTATLVLDVAGWPGHRAGQHVDVRLTAEDGYQAQRSYSIASAPGRPRWLTVERLDDGEVSPYLVGELRPGDAIELRGPVGGTSCGSRGAAAAAPGRGRVGHRAAGGDAAAADRDGRRHRCAAPLLVADAGGHGPRRGARAGGVARGHRGDPHVHALAARGLDGVRAPHRRPMLAAVAWPAAHGPLAYVCGPTSLVETAASGLVAAGYDPAAVRTERFGPTGG